MWYSGNGFLSKEIITLMMLVVIMVKHRKNFWHLLQKGQMWLLWKKKRNTLKGKISKYINNEMTTEMWKELEDNRIILLKKKPRK